MSSLTKFSRRMQGGSPGSWLTAPWGTQPVTTTPPPGPAAPAPAARRGRSSPPRPRFPSSVETTARDGTCSGGRALGDVGAPAEEGAATHHGDLPPLLPLARQAGLHGVAGWLGGVPRVPVRARMGARRVTLGAASCATGPQQPARPAAKPALRRAPSAALSNDGGRLPGRGHRPAWSAQPRCCREILTELRALSRGF